jgi:hypothetical protein
MASNRSLVQRVFGRRKTAVDDTVASHYASAMYAVRTLGDELTQAQARGASIAERRVIHARIDHELARAVAAAGAIYNQLFEAVGGPHHADADLELWKRRLNDALTVRAQHEMRLIDDGGVIPPSNAQVRTRAAFGPHQAGMDFDTDSEGASTPQAGSTATPARSSTGVDLDDVDRLENS